MGDIDRSIADSDHLFTLEELASEFSITPRALRFYEDEGLVAPMRSGRQRFYSERDRARLGWTLRGKSFGFSLADIKEMIDLYDLNDDRVTQRNVTISKCRERIALLAAQKAEIDAAVANLKAFIAVVEAKMRFSPN